MPKTLRSLRFSAWISALILAGTVQSFALPPEAAKPTVDLSIYGHVVQVGWVVKDLDRVVNYWEKLVLKNIHRDGVQEFPDVTFRGSLGQTTHGYDGLSAYMVYEPRIGKTDGDRNMMSNIHPRGTPPPEAAERLALVAGAMMEQRTSGVDLDLSRIEDRIGDAAGGLRAPQVREQLVEVAR